VERILNDPVEWFKEDLEPEKGKTLYRSHVVVRRLGDFIFPVDLEVKFDNGEAVHEKWDGKDRWARFSYQKKAKIVSATVDPGHKILLDRDLFNNSRTATSSSAATHKLTNVWTVFTQLLAQALAWLT
jgi:hypothetical protein